VELSPSGYCYHKLKEYDKAVVAYGEAVRLDPDEWIHYHNRGDIYRGMSKYEEAIRDYKTAISKNGNSAWSYHYMGDCYRELTRYDKADDAYVEATKLDPSHYHGQDDAPRSITSLCSTTQLGIDYITFVKNSFDKILQACWITQSNPLYLQKMVDLHKYIHARNTVALWKMIQEYSTEAKKHRLC